MKQQRLSFSESDEMLLDSSTHKINPIPEWKKCGMVIHQLLGSSNAPPEVMESVMSTLHEAENRSFEKIKENTQTTTQHDYRRVRTKSQLAKTEKELNRSVNSSLSTHLRRSMDPEDEKRRKVDAMEFVQKLQSDKQKRAYRLQKKMLICLQKAKLEEEERQQKQNEIEEEKRKKKLQTLELYRHYREKRAIEKHKNEEQKIKFKVTPENQRLYKKFEKRFHNTIELPILEIKKEELAKRRNFCRRVSKDEIKAHMQKIDENFQKSEGERNTKFLTRRKQEAEILKQLKNYNSSFTVMVKEQDRERKLKEEEQQKGRNVYREKMMNYFKLSREIHPIHIDEEKSRALQRQIETLKHPVRTPRSTKGLSVSQITKRKESLEGNMSTSTHNVSQQQNGKVNMSISFYQSRKRPSVNIKSSPQPDNEKSRPKNYLEELRKRRKEANCSAHLVQSNWQSDFANSRFTEAEKYDRVVEKAALLEERARLEEKVLKVKGGTAKNFEMGTHVSDLFVESIKAKLAVLENL